MHLVRHRVSFSYYTSNAQEPDPSLLRIRLQNGVEKSITATIRPAENRTLQEQQRLRQFKLECDINQLEQITREASVAMGIPAGQVQFCSDVLTLDVRGPGFPRFTIVDTPGLIGGEADNVQVTEMVRRHIANKHAIILAVVNGGDDIENQGITNLARAVDPTSERTFGIINKADRIEPEKRSYWTDIANNKYKPTLVFEQGWHFVMCKSLQGEEPNVVDIPLANRRYNEQKFFGTAAIGREIRKDSWGIDNLRSRLGQLLYKQTQRSLPALREEIAKNIATHKAELRRLSEGLKSPDAMTAHFIEQRNTMLEIIGAAVTGNFDQHTDFFHDKAPDARFLRSVVDNAHDAYALDMRDNGTECAYVGNVFATESKEDEEVCLTLFIKSLKRMRGEEHSSMINTNRINQMMHASVERWEGIASRHIIAVADHCYQFIKAMLDYCLEGLPDMARKLFEGTGRDASREMDHTMTSVASQLSAAIEGHSSKNSSGLATKSALEKQLRKLDEQMHQDMLLSGGIREFLDANKARAGDSLKGLVKDLYRPVKTRNPSLEAALKKRKEARAFEKRMGLQRAQAAQDSTITTPLSLTKQSGLDDGLDTYREHRDLLIEHYKVNLIPATTRLHDG